MSLTGLQNVHHWTSVNLSDAPPGAILLGSMIKLMFVETRVFTECVRELMADEAYRSFQSELMRNPKKGEVIPGCCGLRKVRVGDPVRDKGKRGGLRAIYLHIPEVDRIVLIALYGKDKKDDLTEDEKKILGVLAARMKQEAVQSLQRKRKGP